MRPALVILAGGKGTRLGELTKDTPKPMVEVFGRPFLYWLIKHYTDQGFTDIVVSTGYKAEIIEEYFWPWKLKFERDGRAWTGLENYQYSNHIVVNGDTWLELPLPKMAGPWVCSYNDEDAGAQRCGKGKIKIFTNPFYDIGTPTGLERFKQYFASHPYVLNDTLDKS